MTACTNNGGSRARRAVTAALVGVLSVGAAPMVALATGAAPASGDVQVMADGDAFFKQGTVKYEDGLESGHAFVYKKSGATAVAQGLVPESVSYKNSSVADVTTFLPAASLSTQARGAHYYAYYEIDADAAEVKDSDGTPILVEGADGEEVSLRGTSTTSMPTDPGTYAVVVFYADSTGWSAMDRAATFSIVNGGLEGATLVEDGDVEDTTFAYNGENAGRQWANFQKHVGVAVDGVVLKNERSIGAHDGDYHFGTITEKDKTDVISVLECEKEYTVDVIGDGAYSGQSTKLTFKFEKMDLADADIVLNNSGVFVGPSNPTTNISSLVATINGENPSANSDFLACLDATITGRPASGDKGEYKITIAATEDSKYVKNSKEVTVLWGNAGAYISYDGTQMTSSFTFPTVDLTQEKPAYFDPSKIKTTVTNASGAETDHKVIVTNYETGASATEADLQRAGKWLVTVKVLDNVNGQTVVGLASVVVVNTNVISDSDNIFVTYDGKAITNNIISDDYTGSDLLEKLSVEISKGNKVLVEGTDYTIEVKKQDSTGKWVAADGVVDAGSYQVTIKGISFSPNVQYTFDVDPRTLVSIAPSNAFATQDNYVETTPGTIVKGTRYYFAHTGEEIAPEFTFKGDDGKTYTVPADQLEVTYEDASGNPVDLKDEGDYTIDTVTIKPGNFAYGIVMNVADVIEVTTASAFVDVPNDAWYAEAVATAKQQGYIGGVGGSNLFAPMRNMSRADVVCVLYRMAGGTIDNEGMTDAEKTYISDFTDVDEGAYYAKAVSWAVKTGVARGYGDTFGTSREVTTEEFATMLHRYATLIGNADSVDTDAVLAGVADGDQVSSYARDAVAWAVENGYVASNGNLIDPQGSVYRARVVTIAVRYQPEQLDTIISQNPHA